MANPWDNDKIKTPASAPAQAPAQATSGSPLTLDDVRSLFQEFSSSQRQPSAPAPVSENPDRQFYQSGVTGSARKFEPEALPKRGEQGTDVSNMQQALVDAGVTSISKVDGAFGINTERGVQEFQEMNGLPETGIFDEATRSALFDDTTTEPAETTSSGSMSPTANSLEGPEAAFSASVQTLQNQTGTVSKGAKGNNVLNVQLRLAELGYDIGRGGKSGLKKNALGKWSSLDNSQLRGVDSDFGLSTEKAVKAFQKDAGLPVTGSIDEATAQAMAEKPAVKFEVSEDFVNGLSEKKKVHFNAAKDAATEAGLSGAELAAFMAQVAHESDGFNTAKEYASGSAYEGRKDLGNTQAGDGKRYKGRGYIQLTGRSNYEKAGKALGLDLVGNPSLAEDPKVAADVSVWFWKTKVKPQVPDFLDTERVTKVVNGGFNGLDDRKSYLERFTKKWNED